MISIIAHPGAFARRRLLAAGTIWNGLRCALAIISGIIILYFAFVALCGALQTHFHGWGRGGKRQLPRLFPAETAARRAPPQSAHCVRSQLPQGDAFALCRKPCRHHQKPSPWGLTSPGRGKMSRSDKRGSVASPQAMTEGVICLNSPSLLRRQPPLRWGLWHSDTVSG